MYKHTNAVVRNVEPNDWAWQDFGWSCYRFSLHFRTLDVTLDLKDPHYPNHDLGSLELAVTLIPKEGDFREAVSFKKNACLCFSSWCVWTELRIWSGGVRCDANCVYNCGFIQIYKNSMNCTYFFFFSKYNHVFSSKVSRTFTLIQLLQIPNKYIMVKHWKCIGQEVWELCI